MGQPLLIQQQQPTMQGANNPFVRHQQQQQQQQQGFNQGTSNMMVQHGQPKICHNFRKGRCRYGVNCKFSHDLTVPNVNASGMNVEDTGMDMMMEGGSAVYIQGNEAVDMDSGTSAEGVFRVNSNGEMSEDEVARSMRALTSMEPIHRAPSPDHPIDPLPEICSPWEEGLAREEAEVDEEIRKMWAESGDLNRYEWSQYRPKTTTFTVGRIPTNAPPRRLSDEERSAIVEMEQNARNANRPVPSRCCTANA